MTGSIVQKAYGQLMGIAGVPSDSDMSFDVGIRALETPFYAEECAAAALAAGAIQAADIWQLRGGTSQEVSVSTRKSAASLISVVHQSFENPDLAPEPFDPRAPGPAASGFFVTNDERHVYLHPSFSFPDSHAGLLSLLGCEDTKESVTEAVKQWKAKELEDAIASAGVCGAMVRTPDEWDQSEQGQILDTRPVLEVIKIGEGNPMGFDPVGERPLSGCRVLDLTRVLAEIGRGRNTEDIQSSSRLRLYQGSP
jgi:crotonobetainyl-CoA:carnitine CoA-transferase CaiB-like acyl-CoA transferase